MATISSPGIGSGLDINSIVTKLMTIEQQPLINLQRKEASYQAQLSAYGAVKGALSTVQTAAKALTSATLYSGRSVSVADNTILTASAGSTAAVGTYAVTVSQLAQAQVLRTNVAYAATTTTFNTGSIAINVGGGATTNITIDATNNTLGGIRDAINSANIGVTASVVNDGTTNRLIFSSKTTGLTAGAMSITVTDSGSGGTQALSDLNSASLTSLALPLDAIFSVNGLSITRSGNSVTDAIEGVSLNLTKAGTLTTPVATQITVTRNTSSVQNAVADFVTAYNTAVKQLKSVSAYDATTKQAAVLTGDNTVRGLLNQMSNLAQSRVSGLSGGLSRLSDLGISVQKDGTLSTDSTKLSAALNDTTKDVAGLFSSTATDNKGIAVRLNEAITSILGSSGMLTSRTEGINRSIAGLTKRQEALESRLTTIEANYRRQFTALDSLLASMNQTSSYLTQQLSNLPGARSNN